MEAIRSGRFCKQKSRRQQPVNLYLMGLPVLRESKLMDRCPKMKKTKDQSAVLTIIEDKLNEIGAALTLTQTKPQRRSLDGTIVFGCGFR